MSKRLSGDDGICDHPGRPVIRSDGGSSTALMMVVASAYGSKFAFSCVVVSNVFCTAVLKCSTMAFCE